MALLLLDGGHRIQVRQDRQDAVRALDEAGRGTGWARLTGYGRGGFGADRDARINVRAADVVAVADDEWDSE